MTIVTTLPDTTGVTVIPGTTIETVITRTLTTITGAGTDTTGSIDAHTTSTNFDSVEFSLSCSSGGDTSSQCDTLTEATTNFPVEDTSYLSYEGSTSTLELTESISTEVQVESSVIEIVTDGITTQVTLEGVTTIFTTTISTAVELAISATTVIIEPTPYTLTVPDDSRSESSSYSTTTTLPSTVITLSVDSVSTTISLEGIYMRLPQIMKFVSSTPIILSSGRLLMRPSEVLWALGV